MKEISKNKKNLQIIKLCNNPHFWEGYLTYQIDCKMV